MMKLYHKILFHAASVSWILAGQTSCQDINGNYDRIVPEDYYTVISLKETGVKEVAMSVADRQYDCEVPVLKGGLHVDAVADVVLETPGQKWVDENYNEKQGTAYKVITPSMYSVADYHVRIPSGESGKSAHVILDAEKIYAAMQLPENAGSTLVLPVRIASASDKVNEDKDVVILRCSVSPAEVRFEVSSSKIKLPDDEDSYTTSFVVGKNGKISTDIRFEIMTQEYLDEHYSRPEGVQYVALSGDMFSMES